MKEFLAGEADAGLRADVFIAGRYPKFSRSSLEALFDNQLVQVNDKTAKASHLLKDGDRLMVDDHLLKQKPPKIELPVLYEDDDMVVIDKPAGVLTHSKGALNTEATVASFIAPKLDKELSGNRAGIVHRLDRQTSGIIVTAKTATALSHLQKQFSARKTKKIYWAVVEGNMEPPEALVDVPIARNPKKPQTFYVNMSGKPSQTHYKVLNTIKKNGKTYSLIELQPKTGRTHQLRVHLAYINHPIVGDSVYGHAGGPLMLWARSLELTGPDRRRRVFKSGTPDYFEEFIQND